MSENKFDALHEELSDKRLTSLRKNQRGDREKYLCPKCGFKIPTYKGKYPRYCPLCGDFVDMNKYKLTKSWAQSGLQVDMNPFGDKIEPNDVEFNAHLTVGMKNGLQHGMDDNLVNGKCEECGFKMPKYAGRYPRYCPKCGCDSNPQKLVTTGGIDLQNPNNPVMEDIRKEAEKWNTLIEASGAERFLNDEDDLAVAKELAIKAKGGCGKANKKLASLLQDENDYAAFVRDLGI